MYRSIYICYRGAQASLLSVLLFFHCSLKRDLLILGVIYGLPLHSLIHLQNDTKNLNYQHSRILI